MCYHVGGNTKLYGAALFRLRKRDFEQVQHVGGVKPEWPLKYRDFEPYYAEAEKLYQVHGKSGLDPTEPPRSGEFPYPAMSHEPRIQEVSEALAARGLKPCYTPLGIRINEAQKYLSQCIRCSTCDGYPCLVHAKSDAEVSGVRPVMGLENVTLLTETKVERLLTSPSGREITGTRSLPLESGRQGTGSCRSRTAWRFPLRSLPDRTRSRAQAEVSRARTNSRRRDSG